MGKGIRKKIAVFLTLCMVCSLFAGVPMNVQAEENVGLTITGWLDWGQGEANTEATFGSEENATLAGQTFALRYNGQPVTADQIAVSDSENCTFKQNSDHEKFIDFSFKKTGDYTITYTGNTTEDTANKTVTIKVGLPTIGFYTTKEATDDGYIGNDEDEVFESGRRMGMEEIISDIEDILYK